MLTIVSATSFGSAATTCQDAFAPERDARTAENVVAIGCNASCDNPQTFTRRVAAALAKSFESHPNLKRHARAYAVMTATMIATSYLASRVTGSLPTELEFLKYTVIGVAGMFVVGIILPITEPMSAKYRQFAYGLKAAAKANDKTVVAVMLNRIWLRTQTLLSLNEQMSRNLMGPVFLQIDLGFSAAREAMRAGDDKLAIDQIAMLAVRLRRYYRDLEPAEADIAEAVRASFTRHVLNPRSLETRIHQRIELSDPEAREPTAHEHYHRLLNAWLSPESNNTP